MGSPAARRTEECREGKRPFFNMRMPRRVLKPAGALYIITVQVCPQPSVQPPGLPSGRGGSLFSPTPEVRLAISKYPSSTH